MESFNRFVYVLVENQWDLSLIDFTSGTTERWPDMGKAEEFADFLKNKLHTKNTRKSEVVINIS